MKFYTITINGEVSLIAHLSDEDAAKLRAYCDDECGGLDRIQFVEQDTVVTDLNEAMYRIESDLDSWRP